MIIRNIRAAISGCALLLPCLPLGGCIVGEIRDEMVATNQRLTTVEERIREGTERLRDVDTRMERMASIDTSLQSIDASLKKLDTHLASLRATIDNIDSTIPFLSISGDADETGTDPETEAPGATVQVDTDE